VRSALASSAPTSFSLEPISAALGSGSHATRRWSEPDSNSRSRCDGQRYGVRSLKRRLDRRGMTSGAARNGLRCRLVLLRKPFHASDGPFWSGGLRRAVP
jgi:hypothetical protein